MKKKFLKKEVDSLEVEIKHVKSENYEINKRHTKINKKFNDLEEEIIETITEEFFLLSVILTVLVKLQ